MKWSDLWNPQTPPEPKNVSLVHNLMPRQYTKPTKEQIEQAKDWFEEEHSERGAWGES